jgi:hypothetical protein
MKSLGMQLMTAVAATLLVGGCASTGDATDETTAASDALTSAWHGGDTPYLLTNFYGDGDLGQCNGAYYGRQQAQLGTWTSPIRIDTDNRPGGCWQQFAIVDPAHRLDGLTLKMNFTGTGDWGQCGNAGEQIIPIITSPDQPWSSPIRMDMDNRPGGCDQTFVIEGRPDVELAISFEADGDPGQCGNTGTHTVSSWSSVTLFLDTDSRSGGCRESFSLRFAGGPHH